MSQRAICICRYRLFTFYFSFNSTLFNSTLFLFRCELCCNSPESIGHLLRECPFARNVWALCGGKIQKCLNYAGEFFLLLRMLEEKLPQLELERWATWNVRNKFYFDKVQQLSKMIFEAANGFLSEHQRLCVTQRSSQSSANLIVFSFNSTDLLFKTVADLLDYCLYPVFTLIKFLCFTSQKKKIKIKLYRTW